MTQPETRSLDGDGPDPARDEGEQPHESAEIVTGEWRHATLPSLLVHAMRCDAMPLC